MSWDDKSITEKEHADLVAEMEGKVSIKRCREIIDLLLGKVPVWGFAPYDPNYGDNKLCKCGHPYHRHFDSYEDMSPVGCKYCNHYDECTGYVEAEGQ